MVAVSNPDKVLYPAAGFTKTDVVEYYLRVSRVLLPHLKDRPITLKRYPDGAGRAAFYEKNAPGFAPKWIKTTPVPRAGGGPDINYVLIERSCGAPAWPRWSCIRFFTARATSSVPLSSCSTSIRAKARTS